MIPEIHVISLTQQFPLNCHKPDHTHFGIQLFSFGLTQYTFPTVLTMTSSPESYLGFFQTLLRSILPILWISHVYIATMLVWEDTTRLNSVLTTRNLSFKSRWMLFIKATKLLEMRSKSRLRSSLPSSWNLSRNVHQNASNRIATDASDWKIMFQNFKNPGCE